AVGAGLQVEIRITVGCFEPRAAAVGRARVHLRVPQWAVAHVWPGFVSLEVPPSAAATADATLLLTAGLRAEGVKDERAKFAPLHALLYGPLVLATLTPGPRALRVNPPSAGALPGRVGSAGWEWVHPLPEAARSELVTLRLLSTTDWSSGSGSSGQQAHQRTVLVHTGSGRPAAFAHAPPLPPNRTRAGGSDALHAATFRLAFAPAVSILAGTATPAMGFVHAHRVAALAEGDAVVLEPFDLPGSTLVARRLSWEEWRERALRQPDGEGCLLQAFTPPQVARTGFHPAAFLWNAQAQQLRESTEPDQQVWVAHADGTRNFIPRPSESCKGRAALFSNVQALRKRDGPAEMFALDDAQSRAACARLSPCVVSGQFRFDLFLRIVI
ncbi:hypothetical protein T492DRAFT_964307, partial [Pavlovales sp. CCMP2436]